MRKIIFAGFIFTLFSACNPKQAWQQRSIEKHEKALVEDSKKGKIDTAAINALLNEYEAYADNYPADTLGAKYLFKAADFYRYIHKPLRSIELYKKIYERYPDASRRPYALFLQGFIFENDVRNIHAAEVIYKRFLKEFPDHPMAKDAALTLVNLGKSPEQVIQEFEEKAKQDSPGKMQQ